MSSSEIILWLCWLMACNTHLLYLQWLWGIELLYKEQKQQNPLFLIAVAWAFSSRRSFLIVNFYLTQASPSLFWELLKRCPFIIFPVGSAPHMALDSKQNQASKSLSTTATDYDTKISWEKFIPTLHSVFLNRHCISGWALVKPCICRNSCSNNWVIFYGFCYAESHI